MKARDIMSPAPVTAKPTDLLPAVAAIMQSKNIGAVPIVNDRGELVGMISEGDFTGLARCIPFTLDLAPVIFGARAASATELQTIYDKAQTLRAEQVMSSKLVTIGADEPVGEAIRLMLSKELKHIPVVETKGGRKLIGIIARHDVLKLALSKV